MALTLKQMLDATLRRAGLSSVAAYATSTKDSVLRFVDIANEAASDIARYPWYTLRGTYTFTLTTDTAYDLPSDFRAFIPDTAYTDSHLWSLDFPTVEDEWHYLQASTGGSGVQVKARLTGDKIRIYQPTSGDTISIEYLSRHPVMDADGTTTQERFDADTDTFRLDDELLIKNMIWRIKKLYTLPDWTVDHQDYSSYEMVARGHDGGAQTVAPGEDNIYGAGPYYDLYRPVPNA